MLLWLFDLLNVIGFFFQVPVVNLAANVSVDLFGGCKTPGE